MLQVQLEQTEETLDELVAQAESGNPVTLLRNRRPVAQIIPFPTEDPAPTPEERLAAIKELEAIMAKGYNLGIVWNGRDELYDRDE